MLDIAEVIVGLVLISIAVGILWGGSIVHLKAKRAHRMGMGLAPAVVLAVLLMSAGCAHPQVVASPGQNALLTWGQSVSCTSATPCPSYAIQRETVASAQAPCDALTSTNWHVVGTANTVNATSWTDNTVPSTGYYCWSVQAQQGSPLVTGQGSSASNNGVAMLVTEPPLGPTNLSGSPQAQTASAVKPALPEQWLSPYTASQMAMMQPVKLTVQLQKR